MDSGPGAMRRSWKQGRRNCARGGFSTCEAVEILDRSARGKMAAKLRNELASLLESMDGAVLRGNRSFVRTPSPFRIKWNAWKRENCAEKSFQSGKRTQTANGLSTEWLTWKFPLERERFRTQGSQTCNLHARAEMKLKINRNPISKTKPKGSHSRPPASQDRLRRSGTERPVPLDSKGGRITARAVWR